MQTKYLGYQEVRAIPCTAQALECADLNLHRNDANGR